MHGSQKHLENKNFADKFHINQFDGRKTLENKTSTMHYSEWD